MEILVKTLSNKNFTVKDVDTIHDVKTRIHEHLGIPTNLQVLICAGEVLYSDEKRLADYNIDNDSFLVLIQVSGSKTFQIFLRNLRSKTITLDVKSWYTIEKVKKMIEDKDGTPVDKQILIYGGRLLEDDKSLDCYDIEKESTLQLLLRVKTYYLDNIFNITLPVNTCDTINHVKAKLQYKLRIPRDELRLLSDRTYLVDDNRSLADYNIQVPSVLYLARGPPRKRKRGCIPVSEAEEEEENEAYHREIMEAVRFRHSNQMWKKVYIRPDKNGQS